MAKGDEGAGKNAGEKKRIRIIPIESGTALDHLPVGYALKIVRILKLLGEKPTTIAMNVKSKKLGRKDLVFMEGRELSMEEIEKIALISRGATLNVIRNAKVVKKQKMALPDRAVGIVKCINPNCITNIETIKTKFSVLKGPLAVTCFYCETVMREEDIAKSIR